MKNIAIIGSGSWGVALAIHLSRLGNNIKIWSYNKEECDLINNQRHCKFLPNVELPENITCFTDYEPVIKDADFILHVTPSKATRDTVKQYKKYVEPNKQPIIICSKGFEKATSYTLDEVILDEIPDAKVAALSGPSHAEEVSISIPTLLVVASEHEDVLNQVQEVFACNKMRVYTSKDIKGVELGGALKNIIAFCAGVAAGIKLGDNTFAALITRGLGEISRLGVKLGGDIQNFYGLSGLGDLIVTCLSEHSRNRRAGKLIGEGKTLEETRKIVGMTIESVDNIEVAHNLAKTYNVEMPILETVYKVLYEKLNPKEAIEILMTRELKAEI